ncbi:MULTISPECIES: tetratricopeptide repeat protein [unclassified Sphingobacterium]|uniref:tetratricopeptide repeat protein n=1 Tax=unclassified Sphingobacterium TaxID=2609468 RepID=UPI0025E53FA2|nr:MULTISPECIES: tetratricopeptide repeat protein [unclassified Sphingobacterium]
MNIKRTIVLSVLLSAGTFVFAQTGNLKKAKAAIAKFEELKGAGQAKLGESNLKTASEAINEAIAHEKTKDLAETWTYYALVNANYASINNSAEDAQKAEEGIKKATELDTDKKNADNIKVATQILGQYNFNQGVAAWEKQDFQNAYKSFDKGLVYLPGDTTLTYYSGLAAIQNKDYKSAIEKYKLLIPEKTFSNHKSVLVDLPKLYLSALDTTSALEYASIAAKEYPTDNAAAVQNIELNLIAGNEQKIVSDIESQLAKDPTNKTLFYYLGIARSATKETDKALEAYKKAIELDPNYFEANTNAAVTIMNLVREDINKANNDRSLKPAEYNAAVAAAKDKLKPALPYLLKLVELEPKNVDSLKYLKSYYDFVQDEAKSKEVQAKIDALN